MCVVFTLTKYRSYFDNQLASHFLSALHANQQSHVIHCFLKLWICANTFMPHLCNKYICSLMYHVCSVETAVLDKFNYNKIGSIGVFCTPVSSVRIISSDGKLHQYVDIFYYRIFAVSIRFKSQQFINIYCIQNGHIVPEVFENLSLVLIFDLLLSSSSSHWATLSRTFSFNVLKEYVYKMATLETDSLAFLCAKSYLTLHCHPALLEMTQSVSCNMPLT